MLTRTSAVSARREDGGWSVTLRDERDGSTRTMGPDWTRSAPLPGGEIEGGDWLTFVDGLRSRHPWMDRRLAHHYARLYGARADRIIDGAAGPEGLGRFFGATLYEAEARYLAEVEWAETAEDLLRRRTKHGLHLTAVEQEAFKDWWEAEFGPRDPSEPRAEAASGARVSF